MASGPGPGPGFNRGGYDVRSASRGFNNRNRNNPTRQMDRDMRKFFRDFEKLMRKMQSNRNTRARRDGMEEQRDYNRRRRQNRNRQSTEEREERRRQDRIRQEREKQHKWELGLIDAIQDGLSRALNLSALYELKDAASNADNFVDSIREMGSTLNMTKKQVSAEIKDMVEYTKTLSKGTGYTYDRDEITKNFTDLVAGSKYKDTKYLRQYAGESYLMFEKVLDGNAQQFMPFLREIDRSYKQQKDLKDKGLIKEIDPKKVNMMVTSAMEIMSKSKTIKGFDSESAQQIMEAFSSDLFSKASGDVNKLKSSMVDLFTAFGSTSQGWGDMTKDIEMMRAAQTKSTGDFVEEYGAKLSSMGMDASKFSGLVQSGKYSDAMKNLRGGQLSILQRGYEAWGNSNGIDVTKQSKEERVASFNKFRNTDIFKTYAKAIGMDPDNQQEMDAIFQNGFDAFRDSLKKSFVTIDKTLRDSEGALKSGVEADARGTWDKIKNWFSTTWLGTMTANVMAELNLSSSDKAMLMGIFMIPAGKLVGKLFGKMGTWVMGRFAQGGFRSALSSMFNGGFGRIFSRGGLSRILNLGGRAGRLGGFARNIFSMLNAPLGRGSIRSIGRYIMSGARFAKIAGPVGAVLALGLDGISSLKFSDKWLGKGAGKTIGGKIATFVAGALGGTGKGGKGAVSGAVKGALVGAVIGSIVPGLGTALGAGIGAAVGGILGSIGGETLSKEFYSLGTWLHDRCIDLKNWWGEVTDSAKLVAEVAVDTYKWIVEKYKGLRKWAVDKVMGALTYMFDAITNAVDWALEKIHMSDTKDKWKKAEQNVFFKTQMQDAVRQGYIQPADIGKRDKATLNKLDSYKEDYAYMMGNSSVAERQLANQYGVSMQNFKSFLENYRAWQGKQAEIVQQAAKYETDPTKRQSRIQALSEKYDPTKQWGEVMGMDDTYFDKSKKLTVNNYVKSQASIPKYDVGSNYIASDQLALIHKGEAVIPAQYNSMGMLDTLRGLANIDTNGDYQGSRLRKIIYSQVSNGDKEQQEGKESTQKILETLLEISKGITDQNTLLDKRLPGENENLDPMLRFRPMYTDNIY